MAASVPFSRDRTLELVARYWGFDRLRPLQEEAIRAGCEGRDSVVVLPTGGGKSLCYQVPPLLAERTDIVVSPLISLMKDQVDGLRECGYPAGALHSGMSSEEQGETVRRLRAGDLRLVFVSPERVLTSAFIGILEGIEVGAFAVDEAHCISHWGHDFRLDYRQLAELKRRFPRASVHAYTATATDRVRRDIAEQLNLQEPAMLVGNFDRPNLTYRIVPRVDVYDQTAAVISRHKDEGVIVYCLSRNDTEAMAEDLQSRGIEARPYHAGMDAAARHRTQDAFAAESLSVVTATVAFGMGIDRSNVRCVIHATMPKSLEHYQQETGRAGRDGLEAECVLFYSAADVIRWESLLGRSTSGTPPPPEVFAAQQHLLEQIRRFCSVVQCRHRRLMEYFGQTYTKPDCEACDCCLKETEGTRDGTVTAQQILSCVARVGQRFGVVHVVDVLRGANTERVRICGHNRLSTYGILKETPQKTLTNYVYQLVDHGLLERTADEYPVLRLTDSSWEVIREGRGVMLVEPVTRVASSTRIDRESWDGVDRDLFEHLRGIRRQLATERDVPAFVIFSDATLRDLARRRPGSLPAFREVHGIGEAKADQFGVLFLEGIGTYCEENGLSLDPHVEVSPVAPPRNRAAASARRPPLPVEKKAFLLFEKGVTIEIVATALDRAPSTVEGYLVDFIARTKPKSIAPWVDEPMYRTVAAALENAGSERLKPAFERLDGKVPYAIIRLVAAHLRVAESGFTKARLEAFGMFQSDHQIEDVVRLVGCTRNTAIQYLVEYIKNHRPETIETWVEADTYRAVAEVAGSVGVSSPKRIFDVLKETVSYEEVRFVVSHIRGT